MTIRSLHLPATLLCCLLTLGACATAERAPDGLAAQLKGRAVKLRAYRDGNKASELGFLELRFRDCAEAGDHVECRVDLATEPVQGRAKAVVKGEKRSFTVTMLAEEASRYNLDARLSLTWKGERWSGKGKVEGWLHPASARVPASQVAVRESLDF